MKVLLLGLAAGSLYTLLGDVAPSPGDVLGTADGVASLGSLGVIAWILKSHKDELKETREAFSQRETARDALFNATIKEIVVEFKQALKETQAEFNRIHREMREENQKNIERQFKHSEEVVAALEHVTQSLEGLSQRIQKLEAEKDPGVFHPTPHYPQPGQNPQNPPPPKPPWRQPPKKE